MSVAAALECARDRGLRAGLRGGRWMAVLAMLLLAGWSPSCGSGEGRAVAAAAERGIDLRAYRVRIEARVLEGFADNASGLSFNRVTGTLFAVSNRPPQLAEFSTAGDLLRLVVLRGVGDPEGIAHIEGELFVIADERSHQLVLASLPAGVTELDLSAAPRLGVGIDVAGNSGFEGVAWDAARRRLIVVKEKAPLRVLEIGGLLEAIAGGPFNVQIGEWARRPLRAPALRDLSGVAVHEPSGHVLLLSEASRLIVEYDAMRRPLGRLVLRAGHHGLIADVPQAEGLALGPDGALYLLSEPNLFYRFEPVTRGAAR